MRERLQVEEAVLSILRERRRRSWFISAAEKIKEYNIDALIIPTGTYRYIKALLDTPLKDIKAAVHVIFHGIGKERWIALLSKPIELMRIKLCPRCYLFAR